MATLQHLLDASAGRIERWTRLDAAAEALGDVGKRLRPPGAVTGALSGTPVAHPVHPVLVTVPLGAWTTTVVLDAAGERDAARLTTALGVLGALPAVVTGFSDWLDTGGAERRVGLVHAAVNDVGVVLQAASWWARRRGRHGWGIAASLLGLVTTTVGGWLGGHLSYAMGVGVDTTAFGVASPDWTDVLASSDLPEATPVCVAVGDVAALVLRRGGEVVAIDDRCTHRGAPLHEGTIVAGAIECPWHGSRFDLVTGEVRRGPATRPQTRMEVRERAGRIELRRADEVRALRTNPVSVR